MFWTKQFQSLEKSWSLILTSISSLIHRISSDCGFLRNFFGWPIEAWKFRLRKSKTCATYLYWYIFLFLVYWAIKSVLFESLHQNNHFDTNLIRLWKILFSLCTSYINRTEAELDRKELAIDLGETLLKANIPIEELNHPAFQWKKKIATHILHYFKKLPHIQYSPH